MQPTSNLVHVRSHTCAKKGLRPDENQDSVSPAPNSAAPIVREGTFDITCVAVADGATESYLPGLWSQILTSSFKELKSGPDSTNDAWETWMVQCRKRWQADASARRNETRSGPLSFADIVTINSAEARVPAAATFAGLRLHGAPLGEVFWDAWVLGDSCLFHLRENQQKDTWPYKQSREFTYTPHAALSYPSASSRPGGHIRSQTAHHLLPASVGDVFLLATDALAKWLLKADEQNTPVWGTLLRDDLDLEALVQQAQNDAVLEMENDDASLVVVTIGQPHAWCQATHYTPHPKSPASPDSPLPSASIPASSPAVSWAPPTILPSSASQTAGIYPAPLPPDRLVTPPPQPSRPPLPASIAAPALDANPQTDAPAPVQPPQSSHRPTSKHWLYSQIFQVAYFSTFCTIATLLACSLFFVNRNRNELQQMEDKQRKELDAILKKNADADAEIKSLKAELAEARKASAPVETKPIKQSEVASTTPGSTKTLKPNAIAPSPPTPTPSPTAGQAGSSNPEKPDERRGAAGSNAEPLTAVHHESPARPPGSITPPPLPTSAQPPIHGGQQPTPAIVGPPAPLIREPVTPSTASPGPMPAKEPPASNTEH